MTKISIRLGSLADGVAAAANKAGVKPSEWVRRVIAEKLGVEPPAMEAGNPAIGQHAKQGARARWKRKD